MARADSSDAGAAVLGFALLIAAIATSVWGMTKNEGWVSIRCAGDPWTCQVDRHQLVTWSSTTSTPQAISAGTRWGSRKGTLQIVYLLDFDGEHVVGPLERHEVETLALELEEARRAGTPIQRSLWPGIIFVTLSVFALLFGAFGLYVIWALLRKRR